VSLVVLTGCSLERPYPGKSYYVLASAPAGNTAPVADANRVIRVPRATVAPPFSSRMLQYRVAPSSFEPSYYHNWAGDPGGLVAAAAADALAVRGFTILPEGTSARDAESLELDVRALYVDTTAPTPTIMLAVRATLLDDARAVRMSRDYEQSEPADSTDAADAVEAFNRALGRVLGELAEQVAAAG
jgi:ABC-type uncharacterized transport system auxiliary subunit